jgi:hypothetical protein
VWNWKRWYVIYKDWCINTYIYRKILGIGKLWLFNCSANSDCCRYININSLSFFFKKLSFLHATINLLIILLKLLQKPAAKCLKLPPNVLKRRQIPFWWLYHRSPKLLWNDLLDCGKSGSENCRDSHLAAIETVAAFPFPNSAHLFSFPFHHIKINKYDGLGDK